MSEHLPNCYAQNMTTKFHWGTKTMNYEVVIITGLLAPMQTCSELIFVRTGCWNTQNITNVLSSASKVIY